MRVRSSTSRVLEGRKGALFLFPECWKVRSWVWNSLGLSREAYHTLMSVSGEVSSRWPCRTLSRDKQALDCVFSHHWPYCDASAAAQVI